jgi:hypothetical protein
MTFEQNQETPEFVAEHELRVGALSTPVRVRISRRKSDGALLVEQSHFIKTAIQYLPHSANQPFFCAESKALDEILGTMTSFYDQAIRRGYKPSENWLIANTGFRPSARDQG